LAPVVDALIGDGVLIRADAWLSPSGFTVDAGAGHGDPIAALRWIPTVVNRHPQRSPAKAVPDASPPVGDSDEATAERRAYWVNPFLRRLAPWKHASDDARIQYAYHLRRLGLPPRELPAGYTLVNGHDRSRVVR
jgi:hypothetical protein